MSWFNAFGRRITSMSNPQRHNMMDDDQIEEPEIESSLGSFGRLMISILVFPLQVLFLPLRVLGLFHQTGVPAEDYENYQELSFGGKLWSSTKKLGRTILMLPYLIVTAPIRFFRGVANSGTREILFVIPALLMLGFLGYVAVQVMGRSETISNRYAKEIQQAMAKNDFKLAKNHFRRLMEDHELSQPQRLQYMVCLDETGEREKAQEILDEMAPDDGLGFAPAHRVKALQIAFSRKDKEAPLQLEQLEKHLRLSRDESPMIQQAWVVYYKAIDQPDKAIEALRKGAARDPSLLIAIAKYQDELDRQDDRLDTLREAEKQFGQMLELKPMNSTVRWLLANSISQQGRLDDAQVILVKGMKLNQDNQIRQANAEFFTIRHDIEQRDKNRVGIRLNYLFRALGAQPFHLPIYERLIKLASEKSKDGDNFVRVRDELNHLIAGDEPNPMAHFALSNVLWEHGDFEKATVHLELAYKIEPRFTIVLNNLAWVLAHQDPPKLERALALAKQAVKSRPEEGRYHDTLGTIYLKLEQYKDAAAELELSLPGVDDKIAVRKKLVTVYTNLEMLEQAKIQEDLIEAAN